GTLWFTTANGAAVIDPAHLASRTPRIVPKIDRVIVDQTPIMSPEPNVTLGPRMSMLEIDYTAVSLSSASKVRFRYMLEGFDKAWVRQSCRRHPFTTTLPPLPYRPLRGATTGGGGESLMEWPFSVRPFFYQPRLFYASAFACLGGLVAIGWWLRLRRLKYEF